ncbi:G/U mismatch-specific uracil-DNA glycosylase [Marinospirillum celere]|uniref:G/U mismatch-specific uracil-DNA glycosylase n=1 Tax=Marinospirillum celere TaxID=1122252 RepID=A0A1I1EUW7_9GAMM|nr:DNA-deoxyinosine glycosylase [Marinospirillum celere]SFB90767.1 G/U mismatch-specific uracil-DNA glycosylase [Marinospirillum celere]
MQPINSFPPVEPSHCQVLILGSMPGKASLQATRYYAHPRNTFWPIMAELLEFCPSLDYKARLKALTDQGIGLWDVMHSCVRSSSLDADILEASIEANDFIGWFQRHPETQAIFCNGGKAWQSYRKYVQPDLPTAHRQLPVIQLPSTSPAHARQGFTEKLSSWRQLLDYLDH